MPEERLAGVGAERSWRGSISGSLIMPANCTILGAHNLACVLLPGTTPTASHQHRRNTGVSLTQTTRRSAVTTPSPAATCPSQERPRPWRHDHGKRHRRGCSSEATLAAHSEPMTIGRARAAGSSATKPRAAETRSRAPAPSPVLDMGSGCHGALWPARMLDINSS